MMVSAIGNVQWEERERANSHVVFNEANKLESILLRLRITHHRNYGINISRPFRERQQDCQSSKASTKLKLFMTESKRFQAFAVNAAG